METLFNLTLFDVKIQKYVKFFKKKKKKNKHAKVSGLLFNAFLNYLE